MPAYTETGSMVAVAQAYARIEEDTPTGQDMIAALDGMNYEKKDGAPAARK